jgi:septum formation protein
VAPHAAAPGSGRPLLVLGSASPARAQLLRSAGVTPVVLHSRVDEEATLDDLRAGDRAAARDPHTVTQLLARAKSHDVAEQVRQGALGSHGLGRDPLVVGADSMLDFDGQVLGKARSAQEVRDRWAAMSGRTGLLVTGHTVVDVASGRTAEATVATTVRFGRPDEVELEAYIASGEPLAVAGSCTIDGLGGPFIEGLDGDHTNVIGLALPTLRSLLRRRGVRWTDLWDAPADRACGT